MTPWTSSSGSTRGSPSARTSLEGSLIPAFSRRQMLGASPSMTSGAQQPAKMRTAGMPPRQRPSGSGNSAVSRGRQAAWFGAACQQRGRGALSGVAREACAQAAFRCVLCGAAPLDRLHRRIRQTWSRTLVGNVDTRTGLSLALAALAEGREIQRVCGANMTERLRPPVGARACCRKSHGPPASGDRELFFPARGKLAKNADPQIQLCYRLRKCLR